MSCAMATEQILISRGRVGALKCADALEAKTQMYLCGALNVIEALCHEPTYATRHLNINYQNS